MKHIRFFFLFSILIFWMTNALATESKISVVATIKPVHALVASLMQGVGEPTLIIDGASSPHTYSLKPSQIRAIGKADLIFWIGPDMETFLQKAITATATHAKVIELMQSPNLLKFPIRQGVTFDRHGHDDNLAHQHDHQDHDEHSEHHHTHGHAAHIFDTHIWLDPQNAKAMVEAMAAALSESDPENAPQYEKNAASMMVKLDKLTQEITALLAPVRDKHFIVFHDAYQYFEKRFGLSATGSIMLNPEVMPSAARLRKIQEKIQELDSVCVFAEPQFTPKLVSVILEGTKAQFATLDPLGAHLDAGPHFYSHLIRTIATSIRDCFMVTEKHDKNE